MKIFSLDVQPMRWLALAALTTLVSCGGGSAEDRIASQTDSLVFSAELTGAQETPPNGSTGTGIGLAIVNLRDRSFAAAVITTGVVETIAHIHEAPPRAPGPVVFPLTRDPGKTVWNAKGTLTQAQLDTMRAGGFYFNVHSATFSEGEIRGQIQYRLPSRDQLDRLLQAAQQSSALKDLLQQARSQAAQ